MSQVDQASEGFGGQIIEIGAERCCNQRLLPLTTMLDLGTFCGIPYPLGVVPPGPGRRSGLHDVTPTRSGLGMNVLLRNGLALFPGSREAGCYLPI